MKKFLLACALASVVATTVHADPKDRRPPTSEERAVQMQKSLQLTDEQTAKVKQILATEDSQRKTLHDKYQPQLEAFRADANKLREDTKAQVNGVLTPKQQQALEAQHSMHKRFGPPHSFASHRADAPDADAHPH